MKFKSTLAVLMVAAVMLSFGCSKGGSKSVGGSYDPCDFITMTDAEAALGMKLKLERHDTEASNAMGQKICMYGDAADEDMKFVQLSIQAESDMSDSFKSSGQGVKSLFENLKSYAENPVSVGGVGNAAFYGGSGLKPGAGLTVLDEKNHVLFNVTVGLGKGNSDEQAHIDMEKKLALKAMGKM